MTTPAYTDLMHTLDQLNKVKLDFDDRALVERVVAYAAEEPDICAYALAVLLLLHPATEAGGEEAVKSPEESLLLATRIEKSGRLS